MLLPLFQTHDSLLVLNLFLVLYKIRLATFHALFLNSQLCLKLALDIGFCLRYPLLCILCLCRDILLCFHCLLLDILAHFFTFLRSGLNMLFACLSQVIHLLANSKIMLFLIARTYCQFLLCLILLYWKVTIIVYCCYLEKKESYKKIQVIPKMK